MFRTLSALDRPSVHRTGHPFPRMVQLAKPDVHLGSVRSGSEGEVTYVGKGTKRGKRRTKTGNEWRVVVLPSLARVCLTC